MSRPLLILDLDETLWQGVQSPAGVSFLLRPHLREFLLSVSEVYDLALWSSASLDWMEAGCKVVREETGFDLPARCFFVWDSTRCTMKRTENGDYECRKPARKLRARWIRENYPRERILAVDDTPAKWACGYGHLARISEWTGNTVDDQLLRLMTYLRSIAHEGDLRRIEKRGWATR